MNKATANNTFFEPIGTNFYRLIDYKNNNIHGAVRQGSSFDNRFIGTATWYAYRRTSESDKAEHNYFDTRQDAMVWVAGGPTVGCDVSGTHFVVV